MPSVNNTERIRAWLRTCPHIVASNRFGADYMGGKTTEYSIISVPSMLRYRENILGKEVLFDKQEQNFIFAALAPYSNDIKQNLENLGFFQDVASWIDEQNQTGNYPEWDGGKITAIHASNTGAPVQTGANEARYQFQIRVTYRIDTIPEPPKPHIPYSHDYDF